MKEKINIGRFELSRQGDGIWMCINETDPENSGEGMGVHEEKLVAILEKFYKKNF